VREVVFVGSRRQDERDADNAERTEQRDDEPRRYLLFIFRTLLKSVWEAVYAAL